MEETTVYLFEEFLSIEDRYNFFDFEINNIKIWQYIRYTYCSKLLEELTGILTINRSAKYIKQEEERTDKNEWIKKRQFLLKKKDLLVVNHPRRVKEGNSYRCFVTDAFLESLDCSYYVFEYAYGGKHFKPVKTHYLRYRDVSVIEKYLPHKDDILQADVRKFTDKVNGIFEKELNTKLSNKLKQYIDAMVNSTLREIFYGRIYASIILSLIRPKAVITTNSYELHNQTLIETAKKKKIPTIELEHGRIGDSHAAYNFKRKRNLETFSDYLFVYGEYERNKPRYPIDKANVFAVGYPELERKAKIYQSRTKKKRDFKIITFISSPVDGKVISRYAIELSKRIKGKDIRIVYKLHPSEYGDWKKYYPGLEESGIHIIKENEHDIYYYISRSDYIVGISSTVLFEAMLFETEIIVIKELDFMKSEIVYNCGRAMLALDFEDMCRIIENNIKHDKCEESDYFTPNALFNMKQALDNIIEKSE